MITTIDEDTKKAIELTNKTISMLQLQNSQLEGKLKETLKQQIITIYKIGYLNGYDRGLKDGQ